MLYNRCDKSYGIHAFRQYNKFADKFYVNEDTVGVVCAYTDSIDDALSDVVLRASGYANLTTKSLSISGVGSADVAYFDDMHVGGAVANIRNKWGAIR